MHSRSAGFQRFALIGVALFLAGLVSEPAFAEMVPFSCIILPGEDVASILMTNALDSDASCIVTCRFVTTKYGDDPQITCAKPVPSGKEVEMCRLTSGPNKLFKLIAGYAECTKLK